MNRSAAHTKLVRDILMTFGSRDGLLLTTNECGRARYISPGGKDYFVPYGFPTANGGPDLLGLLAPRAVCFGMEVKTGKATTSADQKMCHEILGRFGMRVFVVRSVEEAGRAIAEMRERSAA